MKISTYYTSNRKRSLDLILALFFLFFLSPFFVLLSIVILIKDGKPIIFKQKRLGENKNIFILYKFRTMKKGSAQIKNKLQALNEAPYPMFKIKNDPRFTNIGRFLSVIGIDEIPQLINILKGEMSFIGPRPLPIDEAKQLDKSWDFRYKVKPGLLSKWALSPKRHFSLPYWKKLEKEDLESGSMKLDILFLINYIKTIFIKELLRNR